MKICVFPRSRSDAPLHIPECDVALFGFSALGEVDYESELSGRTDKFGEMARLSFSEKCAVLCGCTTDSRGLKRRSVAAADRGRLLGISDMLNVLDGDEVRCGAGLGIYTLSGYKVGVIVDGDLCFPEIIKSLSECGCNLAVAVMREVSDEIPPLIIRSYAYLYGVPIVMVASGAAYFADISGIIATSNQSVCTFETVPKNAYRLVTSRRRGLIPRESGDY